MGRCKDSQEEDEDGEREAKVWKTRSKGERKGMTTDPSVSLPHPSTYPDKILTYTWDNAITYVLLHTPVEFLAAGQYRSQVHCSDGVIVPPEISNDLSLGLSVRPVICHLKIIKTSEFDRSIAKV